MASTEPSRCCPQARPLSLLPVAGFRIVCRLRKGLSGGRRAMSRIPSPLVRYYYIPSPLVHGIGYITGWGGSLWSP